MTDRLAPPRIAIDGVGQYGAKIARLATEKGWPVVAAFNRAGPKVGQDLGRVAGLDRDLGIVVQDNESGDFEGLDADVGVVTHCLRPTTERFYVRGLDQSPVLLERLARGRPTPRPCRCTSR